jgi:hypothetical protein
MRGLNKAIAGVAEATMPNSALAAIAAAQPGVDSGESTRLRARNAELEHDNHVLRSKVGALESELTDAAAPRTVEAAKTAALAAFDSLLAALKSENKTALEMAAVCDEITYAMYCRGVDAQPDDAQPGEASKRAAGAKKAAPATIAGPVKKPEQTPIAEPAPAAPDDDIPAFLDRRLMH